MFQESLEEEKRKSKMLETVLIDQLCRCRNVLCTFWILLILDLLSLLIEKNYVYTSVICMLIPLSVCKIAKKVMNR